MVTVKWTCVHHRVSPRVELGLQLRDDELPCFSRACLRPDCSTVNLRDDPALDPSVLDVKNAECCIRGMSRQFCRDVLLADRGRPAEVVAEANFDGEGCPEDAFSFVGMVRRRA
jgi:hypothetical protein